MDSSAPEKFLDLRGVGEPGPGGEAEDGHQPVPLALHLGHLVETPAATEDTESSRLKAQGLRYVLPAVHYVLYDLVQLVSLIALPPDRPSVPEESSSSWLLDHDRHREHGLYEKI